MLYNEMLEDAKKNIEDEKREMAIKEIKELLIEIDAAEKTLKLMRKQLEEKLQEEIVL